MYSVPDLLSRYAVILEHAVLEADALQREVALTEAFDLGRSLLATETTPENVVGLHHELLQEFSKQHPELRLSDVVDRLTLPLMELTMAHSMAFREQLQQRQHQELAARMEQASRLEALGTLAAGVAHDFNTLLGNILGYAELTSDELGVESIGRAYLKQIEQACARAHNLVRRMLDFAAQRPTNPVSQNLVEQIEAALSLLRPGLSKDIELRWKYGFESSASSPNVFADLGQIQQVVMNLCINAADAMPTGGELCLWLGWASALDHPPPDRSDNVCLQVSDTGCGILPEVLAHIFEPFFTTKAPRGSGLGLSVVYGIVKQLGGEVRVSSRCSDPAPGTMFQIFLPVAPTTHPKESPDGTYSDH